MFLLSSLILLNPKPGRAAGGIQSIVCLVTRIQSFENSSLKSNIERERATAKVQCAAISVKEKKCLIV
jgi:hypothetical protein